MIPNIIHQIWMNREENGIITEPDYKTKKMMNKWKNNFEKYILWNGESMKEYIYKTDKKFLEIYNALPIWVNRCDIFRYFVLYHMGGIYVDCDAFFKDSDKILSKLEGQKCVLINDIFALNGLNNFFMASEKHFDFMRLCYENVSVDDKIVIYSTGPFYLDKMYKKYPQNIKIYENIDFPIIHLYTMTWVKDQTLNIFPTIFIVVYTILIAIVFIYSLDFNFN